MNLFTRMSSMIVQNIGLCIIALSVVAYFFPDYFSWMTHYTTIFLSIAMFGMGTSITADAFKNVFLHPKEVLIGCCAQYLIMPLSAWLLATLLKLPPDLALGVILVGCCPGGTASNVITHIAKGHVPLSVAMTIVSTLLAPLLTPFFVYLLAGAWVEVSFFSMVKTVITVVLIPVVLGILANRFLPRTIEKAGNVFPLISSIAIIFIVAGIIADNSEKILTCGFLVLVVVILHNALGLLGGIVVSKIFKFEYDKATALAIEIGMQNSGLAVSLAATNFAINPLATLPGAIFSIWHNVSGSIFAGFRRRHIKTGE